MNLCATRKRNCTPFPLTSSRIRSSSWAMRFVKCSTKSVSDPERGRGLCARTKRMKAMDGATLNAADESGLSQTAATLKISEMPEAERPREKLLDPGRDGAH